MACYEQELRLLNQTTQLYIQVIPEASAIQASQWRRKDLIRLLEGGKAGSYVQEREQGSDESIFILGEIPQKCDRGTTVTTHNMGIKHW